MNRQGATRRQGEKPKISDLGVSWRLGGWLFFGLELDEALKKERDHEREKHE